MDSVSVAVCGAGEGCAAVELGGIGEIRPLRDDVHDAANRPAAVELADRPLQDLDALDLHGEDKSKLGGDIRCGDDALAVQEEDEAPPVQSADIDFSAPTSVMGDIYTRESACGVGEGEGLEFLELTLFHHGDATRGLGDELWNAAGSHNHRGQDNCRLGGGLNEGDGLRGRTLVLDDCFLCKKTQWHCRHQRTEENS